MGEVKAINPGAIASAKPDRRRVSQFVEDPSAPFLLAATDQNGKRCWFIRCRVMGLYERRFGPFMRRSEAIKGFDEFLDGAIDALTNTYNEFTGGVYELIQWPSRRRPKGRAR